ncbi:MAG: carboxylesterase family protein [Pseudomonadota bacterium]
MRRREFCAVTGVATLGVGGLVGCSSRPTTLGPVIQTDTGKVQGTVVDGVHRFLGVPYAEPPFGLNRFVAPTTREPWDGVLAATEYGQICPQTGGLVGGDLVEGEDCLNLNIWTPDPNAGGLPVMVWVHGGGQVSGSGAEPTYDGTRFAQDGVVLITNNRRLGAEGYLFLEEDFGTGIGPGNLGILDQIEVLRWVQRNVDRFGGDPNNVTLFGESGGGAATQAVVATPAARGLVHRVIPQSGGHSAQRPDTARAITATALPLLQVAPGDLDALRALDWRRPPEIYPSLQATSFGRPQIYIPMLSEAMPNHPVDACAAGLGNEVDYLIGSCRDEMNLFDALPGDIAETPFLARRDALLTAADADLAALRRAYTQARPQLDAAEVDLAIMGDLWFRVPSIRIADTHATANQGRAGGARTYMYLFAWESPLLGAAHAMDLLVFGNGLPLPGIGMLRDHDDIARSMRTAWVNFATHGDPSSASFQWPQYDQARRTARLDDTFSVLDDPYAAQRATLGDLLLMNWGSNGI